MVSWYRAGFRNDAARRASAAANRFRASAGGGGPSRSQAARTWSAWWNFSSGSVADSNAARNSPSPSRSTTSPRPSASALIVGLAQPVARGGVQVEAVDTLQVRDLAQGLRGERDLPVEGVQHDALQQIPERHVLQLGEGLEDLEQALLHARPRLDSLDDRADRLAANGLPPRPSCLCDHGN